MHWFEHRHKLSHGRLNEILFDSQRSLLPAIETLYVFLAWLQIYNSNYCVVYRILPYCHRYVKTLSHNIDSSIYIYIYIILISSSNIFQMFYCDDDSDKNYCLVQLQALISTIHNIVLRCALAIDDEIRINKFLLNLFCRKCVSVVHSLEYRFCC